jgi:small-conductance mechanosensitive channel
MANLLVNRAIILGALALGGMVALSAIGLESAPVMVGVGVAGVAIAFGFRDIIANAVCGLIVMVDRPLKVGDFVDVEGATGTVVDVGLLASTIATLDNLHVLVPSKAIILNSIVNYTRHDPKIRLNIPVGVAYGTDMEKVKEVLLEAAREHTDVLAEPPPDARIVEFGDSSVDLVLFAWVDNPSQGGRIQEEVNWEINRLLVENKIAIPFPQRDARTQS